MDQFEAAGAERGEDVDRERGGGVNVLEFAFELIPVAGSKFVLEVREANARYEIVDDIAHIPTVVHVDQGMGAHERVPQRTQGPGSGSMHRRTGGRLHAVIVDVRWVTDTEARRNVLA